MDFKPKKSRSLSIRKGKIDEYVCFKVAIQVISRISQEPWKMIRFIPERRFIGRSESLDLKKASLGLQATDKCDLPGKYKVGVSSLYFVATPRT
ncbi:reverse transcriptase [Plakobranchus ocellatus]|uniref:Reverse transcriptase n=1 Tax=Plakobranchus ocellatus TaxID=259542 RepID=A0AAV4BYJ8_9GAST|nr:reverse transcriptase [Plakobranchus ocellatus]